MKKHLLVLCGALSFLWCSSSASEVRSGSVSGQCTGQNPAAPQETLQETAQPDRHANFQGGNVMSFRRWVAGQIRYPDKARRKKIAGRVVARFVIEPDGQLDSIEIIESPHPSLAAEVERVLRTSLRWTPATSGGQPVRAKYTVPFVFQLPESPK